MTHRDGFPRFSAGTVWRSDARHRKADATPSESRGKPPFWSCIQPAGGRRNTLPMRGISCGSSPTRRTVYTISMGHYQCPLV
jgi:hypothetical protein